MLVGHGTLAVVAVVIMLTAQEGLWGLVVRRFDFLSVRRHLTH